MLPFAVLNPLPDPGAAGPLGLGLYGIMTSFCLPSELVLFSLHSLSVHTFSRLKNSILVVLGLVTIAFSTISLCKDLNLVLLKAIGGYLPASSTLLSCISPCLA